MRALITGATGFVGSRLTRHLVAKGEDVAVIVRPTSDLSQISGILDRLGVFTDDGAPETLEGIVRRVRPEVVFHLATFYVTAHRPEEIPRMIRSNIEFPCRLVDAMVRQGCHRLVNTGSAWQHHEDREDNPVCLHSATKTAFERLLRFYHETSPLRVIHLKLFDTYGPGDPRKKLFHLLEAQIGREEPLAMSPGEQRLDLVHIDDVVRAFEIAGQRLLDAASSSRSESYAVSSGERHTLREVVTLFEEAFGVRLKIAWGGRPYRPREVMEPWRTGKRIPGWTPLIPLQEGLAQLARRRGKFRKQ